MQSTAARVTVAIVSIAVIVVLFVLLSGGDDDSDTTTQAEVTTTTTGTEPTEAPAEDKPKPKPEEPDVPTIEVVGGEPQGGPADLEFTKGDEVRFDVSSDVDEEVHVHGYDVYADLVAGKTATIEFPADIDGVFEVELHGTGALLAELTVRP
jgi:hypothetical protein